MEIVLTTGTDQRFIDLCAQLDAYLAMMNGEEKQQAQYGQYNTLEHIHDVVLIIEDGEALACGSFKAYDQNTVEIKRVFTKESARHKGYGKTILQTLEREALLQGYSRLVLESGTFLLGAHQMYYALGFKRIANYGPYEHMEDSLCMEKFISKG